MVYQSLQKQRRLTQLKNDFISNVTHELKTPITTVGVAIEALSNFNALNDPARTKEYLQISKYELDRLSLLVDKVLKMSLFEKKEPELKLEVFDIKALVSEVLNSMKIQFEKRSAEVDFDTRGQDFSIEADRIHLTSVIFNLIDNALKYSQDSPKLQVAISQEAESLQISVADKGIGIAPEFLDKIFEKFFRISSGDQHNTKGYGLGLSYVASVVKKHHGNIAVNSQPQEGTKFTITLPKKHEEN
jgi:two-component system phosphate regulon sensor histidine kinase PhoR